MKNNYSGLKTGLWIDSHVRWLNDSVLIQSVTLHTRCSIPSKDYDQRIFFFFQKYLLWFHFRTRMSADILSVTPTQLTKCFQLSFTLRENFVHLQSAIQAQPYSYSFKSVAAVLPSSLRESKLAFLPCFNTW